MIKANGRPLPHRVGGHGRFVTTGNDMAITRELPHLDAAIDHQSFQWLRDESTELLAAIEKEITGGVTPDQIKRHIMQRTQRPAIALRCEQAARHIARARES